MSDKKSVRKVSRRTSDLWGRYFEIIKDGVAICNVCETELSYRTTTHNLRRHLIRKHQIYNSREHNISQTTKKTSKKFEEDSCMLANDTSNGKSAPTKDNNLVSPIHLFFDNSSTLPVESTIVISSSENNVVKAQDRVSSKFSLVNSKLLSLFIKDFQPYKIVEEEGFKAFVTNLNLSYKLPTKNYISQVAIPDLYNKCLATSKELLSNGDIFCITLEMWTSVNSDTFLSVTAHFIDEMYLLNSVLLDCPMITFERTSENFAYELKRIVSEWGIEEKIQFAISESDTEIQAAILEDLGFEHFICFVDTMNDIVRGSLQDANMMSLIGKVSSSVSYFKHNKELYKTLRAVGKESKGFKQGLCQISDVKSFLSIYYMLESYTNYESIIRSITEDIKDVPVLSKDEWIVATELCKVLKPFVTVMNTLNDDQYCQASVVIPVVNGILNVCDTFLKKHLFASVKNTVRILKEAIISHLENVESSPTLSVCTFLDPRFKNLVFSDSDCANQAKKLIMYALINSSEEKCIEEETVEEEITMWHVFDPDSDNCEIIEQKQPEEEISVWTSLDNSVALSKPKSNSTNDAVSEVERFLDSPMLPRQKNPLKWWLENKQTYPLLARLAKNQLSAVCNSIPCDRSISKKGLLLTQRRNNLSSKHTNMLVFLNANL